MAKGKRWTNKENEVLAKAWIRTSRQHVSTKGAKFWSDVHTAFVALAPKRFWPDGLFEARSPSMIPKHFKQMVEDIECFHQTLRMVFTKQPRGLTGNERINVAVQIHLGQATNPNRAFVDFDPNEWPNYDAWWELKEEMDLDIPDFIPATTPEEIAAALAPRTVTVRKQQEQASAAAAASRPVEVPAAITPALVRVATVETPLVVNDSSPVGFEETSARNASIHESAPDTNVGTPFGVQPDESVTVTNVKTNEDGESLSGDRMDNHTDNDVPDDGKGAYLTTTEIASPVRADTTVTASVSRHAEAESLDANSHAHTSAMDSSDNQKRRLLGAFSELLNRKEARLESDEMRDM